MNIYKKLLKAGLYIGLSFLGVNAYSQNNVGIGTSTPNASAALDVVSTTKGLLVPRVADTNDVSAPATSLIVYQISDGVFYYWDITHWAPFGSGGGSGSGNAWELSGNAVSPGDFFGTTNNQDIEIRTNNNEVLRVRGNILEFKNSGSSVFIGANAGLNDNHTSSSNFNVFVGEESGEQNLSGAGNTAIGYRSYRNGTVGNDNTAIGREALRSNTSGSFNVGLGRKALELHTLGSNNIGIGYESGLNITNGTNNTLVGTQAGRNMASAGFGNVFLGYRAGFAETGNNKLYIENSNSATPLLYGEFDNNILRAGGEFQINNPSSTGYRFPTADGTNGQVLVTNGTGTLSWGAGGASGSDDDWYEVGTTTAPNSISDNIFTQGNVGIGTTTPATNLDVLSNIIVRGSGANATRTMSISSGSTQNITTTNDMIFNAGYNYELRLGTNSPTTSSFIIANGSTFAKGFRFDENFNLLIGPLAATNYGTEVLHVDGNIRVDGAIMPGNDPGTSGQVMLSDGAGNTPFWGPEFLNTANTVSVGKFFISPFNIPANSITTVTVADPNCTTSSSIHVNFRDMPWTVGEAGNVIIQSVEAENGQFKVVINNFNIATSWSNVQMPVIAFY